MAFCGEWEEGREGESESWYHDPVLHVLRQAWHTKDLQHKHFNRSQAHTKSGTGTDMRSGSLETVDSWPSLVSSHWLIRNNLHCKVRQPHANSAWITFHSTICIFPALALMCSECRVPEALASSYITPQLKDNQKETNGNESEDKTRQSTVRSFAFARLQNQLSSFPSFPFRS